MLIGFASKCLTSKFLWSLSIGKLPLFASTIRLWSTNWDGGHVPPKGVESVRILPLFAKVSRPVEGMLANGIIGESSVRLDCKSFS